MASNNKDGTGKKPNVASMYNIYLTELNSMVD